MDTDFLQKVVYDCGLILMKYSFYYLMVPAQENIINHYCLWNKIYFLWFMWLFKI